MIDKAGSWIRIGVVLLVLLFTQACKESSPGTLVKGGYDEKEMDAAIARARNEVDQFVEKLTSKAGDAFAVKAPISDSGQTEHFWLSDVVYNESASEFVGVIDNDPGLVKNVKIGQKWTIKKSEISDWMYFKNGKIHGNYTLVPLLKTMPAEEAKQLRAMMAEPGT